MNQSNKQRIRWITRTAVLTALLLALQWATSGTQAFAGQYITGSLVNCVLAVAALFGGLWAGVVVAVLSPVFAFLLGVGPKLVQIVPCIVFGNLVFVLLLERIIKRNTPVFLQATGLLVAAAAKFGALYAAVVKIVIPAMGAALKTPQIQTFTVMFSWPQMVTAAIGGALALLALPILRKAIKE